MEVTIAMMISAILILIVYTAFSVVSNAYHHFIVQNEQAATVVQLDRLLKRDFRRAELIVKNGEGLLLTSDKDSVRYLLDSNYIVRISGITDTFKVKTESSSMLFEQEPVGLAESGSLVTQVDELQLNLYYPNDNMHFIYYKPYSSANLFNQDDHAGN